MQTAVFDDTHLLRKEVEFDESEEEKNRAARAALEQSDTAMLTKIVHTVANAAAKAAAGAASNAVFAIFREEFNMPSNRIELSESQLDEETIDHNAKKCEVCSENPAMK